MTEHEFIAQMDRLASTYGKHAYPEERTAQIWAEVQHFDASWFEQAVGKLIGDFRHAPMLSDIREFASRERERLREVEKRTEKNETVRALRGAFSTSDIGMIMQTMIGFMTGKVSREQFDNLKKLLAEHVDHYNALNPPACRRCDDRGVIIDEANYGFRCTCYRGGLYKSFPVYQHSMASQVVRRSPIIPRDGN